MSLRAVSLSVAPAAQGRDVNRAGAWRRVRWQHPEWWLGFVVLTGWAGLAFAHTAEPDPAAATHHGAQGAPAHVTGEPLTVTLLHWLAMAAATMLPTALPVIRDVALSSLWRRRLRSTVLVTSGFLAAWWTAGVVVLAAVDPLLAALDPGRVLVTALLATAAWELTATKRGLLRSCHRHPVLPPAGLRADTACLGTGLRLGGACCLACGPLMLTMAAAGHRAVPLALVLAGLAAARRALRDGWAIRVASAGALTGLAAAASVAGLASTP